MDGYSGKRGIMTPRKGYNVASSSSKDQNGQFCNRVGCSGRLKYNNSPSTKIGSSDKAAKCSNKPSFSGQEMIGTSSRGKSLLYLDSKRKSPSPSEISSPSGDSSRSTDKSVQTDIGSSSTSSNVRPQKVFRPKKKGALCAPPVSKTYGLGTVSNNKSRYGLKNLKCNSASDVVRPSYSSSEPKTTGKNVMKVRSSEGESSSTRKGRQETFASASMNGRSPTSGISIYDSGGNNSRTRLSFRQNGRNSLSFREPPLRISNPDSEMHGQQFSANGSSSSSSSYSSNDENESTMMMPFTHLRNHDSLQRYNMDGIAEILLALERIEQDAELTHEQLLALETGLFLSGLNLFDQHRDMRLDIDNMSYEELLALEERMGTVSTALSEEDLAKVVQRSIYTESTPRVLEDGDDIKCSICQEEYAVGDEMGKIVECQHRYHVACINEWLRLKNWCPICKKAAQAQ